MEKVKELVRMAAIFTPGRPIQPVWFDWQRKQHRIIQTTYFWQERRGDNILLHFAVTDNEALYELIYNPQDQSWLLQGIEAG